MRVTDENTAQALTGSRPADRLVCWVWYDGQLAMDEPLPVAGWSMRWDGSEKQKVPGTINLSIKDPDGKLGPWLYSDPLGIGGNEIQIFYVVGGASDVRMGRYRISGNQVEESWLFKTIREDGYSIPDSLEGPGMRQVAVTLGSAVDVTAVDLTDYLDGDAFLAPEQPVGASPTVVSEVTRIVGDTMPIVWQDVTDRSVPKASTWEDNRVEAVMDLLAMTGATFRMGPNGELECYTKSREPVFELAGGDDGVLINLSRGQSLDGVFNVGSVSSTRKGMDSTGQEIDVPIVGTYEIPDGDLRVGGPFKRRTTRNSNPLMDSQAKVDAAAKTLVLNKLASQSVELAVSCLPDPRIQTGDYGTVVTPVVDGRQVPLLGEVLSVSLSGDGATVNQMQLTVSCLLGDVAAALKGHTIVNNFG